MTTAVLTHPACLDHRVPTGHPERPDRLSAVLAGLKTEEFQGIIWNEAPEATRAQLGLAHESAYVESILGPYCDAAKARGFVPLDADTVMSAGTAQAALRAAGAAVCAVDLVMRGEVANAFCAVRPPGHHAPADRAMGFCIFNNIAVAALHARQAHGLHRVAAIDFDVHHGNGTQDIFWDDANLFYASTHQSPLYPGTGARGEHGIAGNVLNVPLAPGAGGAQFRAAYRDVILPALEAFAPEFVFISAGFDAHKADPLANMNLDETDFAWVTRELCVLAGRACAGRVVSTLEGGYDLQALARSAQAHVRVLMEF